ncbi:hypothetical protein GTW64_10745 [Streptomyces sp. SID4923]|nr:hypothetical protein [Streptomyces sp. SID4923]
MAGSMMMSAMVAFISTAACSLERPRHGHGSHGIRRGLPPALSRRSPSWTRTVLTASRPLGSWSG